MFAVLLINADTTVGKRSGARFEAIGHSERIAKYWDFLSIPAAR
jgi:hypothetical protein